MKLQSIAACLRENNTNYIEYYEGSLKCTVTYSCLYKDICRIVLLLEQNGVKKGDRIGILGANSYNWILADLACIFGSFVSIALDAKQLENGIDQVAEQYNIRFLFISETYLNDIPIRTALVKLESIASKNNEEVLLRTSIDGPGEDDIFAIVFTSGTTAKPKGIELRANSVGDFITNVHNLFEIYPNDKVIIFLPLSNFGQRSYVYAAAILGFNIVLVPISNLFLAMRTCQPTILIAMPHFFETVFELFKAQEENIKERLHTMFGNKMRFMVTGSAPANRKTLEFFNQNGLALYEAYGTTETGLIALNYPGHSKIGSVGKVFPNKNVLIEEEGQIIVKGKYCWGTAYLDELTENNRQVFRDDGYIHTGDIGYFDDEGFLYIGGRIKEMIVLSNGNKLLPGIVEQALNSSEYIKQSIAFGDGYPYITAILVLYSEDMENAVREEVQLLNKTLPEYARIRNYVITTSTFSVENGYLTPSLKLNRSLIYKGFQQQLQQLY